MLLRLGLVAAAALTALSSAAAGDGAWQQNMCCRIGGKRLEAGDDAKLARFDLVLTNNMFYRNIDNNTWAAVKKLNPATQIFACAPSATRAVRRSALHHWLRPPTD
jgi:hypothetical protein